MIAGTLRLNSWTSALIARTLGIALGGGMLFVLSPRPAAWAADEAPPNLARERLSLKVVCAKCHNLQIVMDTPMSYDAWQETVQKMVDLGAKGTDKQFDDVLDYLHRTVTTINVNTAEVHDLEIVLNVPGKMAQAIVARRAAQKFTNRSDLKSVLGVNASVADSKAQLIFF